MGFKLVDSSWKYIQEMLWDSSIYLWEEFSLDYNFDNDNEKFIICIPLEKVYKIQYSKRCENKKME